MVVSGLTFCPAFLPRLYGVAQPFDRGPCEELGHREARAKGVFDVTEELGRREGVPTDIEEVVVAAHVALLEAQDVLPEAGKQDLFFVPGGGLGQPVLAWVEGGRGGRGGGRAAS